MGPLNSEHAALHNGILFCFIFVLFQQVAVSFFDDIVERAFQINRELFGFFLQIVVDAGGQLFRSMPIIKIFIYLKPLKLFYRLPS